MESQGRIPGLAITAGRDPLCQERTIAENGPRPVAESRWAAQWAGRALWKQRETGREDGKEKRREAVTDLPGSAVARQRRGRSPAAPPSGRSRRATPRGCGGRFAGAGPAGSQCAELYASKMLAGMRPRSDTL